MPLEVWLLVGEKWERVPEGRDLGGNDKAPWLFRLDREGGGCLVAAAAHPSSSVSSVPSSDNPSGGQDSDCGS